MTDDLPPPSGAPLPPPAPQPVGDRTGERPPSPLVPPAYAVPPGQPDAASGRPSRNALAIAALCCGLGAVIPLVGVVAIVLGIVALNQLGSGFQRGRGLAVAGIVLGALGSLVWASLAVLAIFGAAAGEPERSAAGQVTATQAGTGIEFLTPGDCFTGPRTEQLDTVTVLPCTSPHESQVVLRFELPDGSYPGKDEVVKKAESGCSDRSDPLLTDKAFGELEPSFIYPPDGFSWTQDRTIFCLVEASTGTTTGSALK